jgi:hypothetical protein
MNRKRVILFSAVNSIVLFLFTFFWINNSPWVTGDEEEMIKYTSQAKESIFGKSIKPSPDSSVFINISWEKQLLPEIDHNGQQIGVRPITNRQRIAKLLEALSKRNEHKFIILDVYFKDSSDYYSDSLLQAALSKTKNILIPYHFVDDDDQPDYPIFKAPIALSDYEKSVVENNFLKFKLIHSGGRKTTPLVMYEQIHKVKFQNKTMFGLMNNHLAMNSFILDFRIAGYNIPNERKLRTIPDLDTSEIAYTKIQLADVLPPDEILKVLPEQAITGMMEGLYSITKDKIIVIGDFEDTDIHETIKGPTPGPTILLDVYYALYYGDNLFSIGFVIFLLAGFFLVSYRCFSGSDILESFMKKKFSAHNNIISGIAGLLSYLIYFITLSTISYFFFNIHLTILLLVFYMEGLEQLIKYKGHKLGLRVAE